MGAKLLYRDAQGRDAAADIPEVGGFLGRAVECLVRTDDAMVSRRNCKISPSGGRWVVEDLGSANGTYITTGSTPERRVTQRDGLTHGDIIRCGSLQVRFVEVADAPAQPQRPSIGQAPANASLGPKQPAQGEGEEPKANQQAAPAEKPAEAAISKPNNEQLTKLQEELKKVAADLEAAGKAAQEAQAERDQAVSKLETMESEVKRMRADLSTTKEALEKVSRQAKKDKDELAAESKVTEELRQDLKSLRDQHTKTLAQLDEFKTTGEAKDRQIAAAGEDVRRAKKEVESLNAQLVKLARERDEQVRNINTERGDTDHLRAILKEREKIIEEQRVGIVNQEAQIKDLRKQAEDLEQSSAKLRSERDNLREKAQKTQAQVEDLKSELDRVRAMIGQQGGDQILQLSQDNRTLRRDLDAASEELNTLRDRLQKSETELVEQSKLLQKNTEERKASQTRAQQAQEQAIEAALNDLRSKHQVELAKQEEARQRLQQERDAAVKDRDDVEKELEMLHGRQSEANSSAEVSKQAIATLQGERDQLRQRISGLESELQSQSQALAQAQAQAQSAQASAGQAGGGASSQEMAELKAVATSAYDGITESLGGLRKNLVDLEESFNKIERTVPDKDLARKLRSTLEEVMNCFDEARSQIRSLRAVIE